MAEWWHPYIDAWNRHDGAGVASFMTEGCVYEDVALGETHTGRDDIRDWVNSMIGQFSSNYHFVTTSFQQSGDAYAAEWTLTGTHDGAEGPMPPSGKAFTIRGVSIGTVDGGKIAKNTDYWDMAAFLGQIGMMRAPEGATT